MRAQLIVLVLLSALALATQACNPFSPKIDDGPSVSSFGDPTTVDGYFKEFRYAYQFKDTTFYATLLANDFTFSYRNYDRGLDLGWGRDEEVRTTSGLFQSSESLNLLWGNVLDSSGTATTFDISRTYSLDVTYNGADVQHVDGRAIFHLIRDAPGLPWKAERWRDESTL
jgi:hypothetical protein